MATELTLSRPWRVIARESSQRLAARVEAQRIESAEIIARSSEILEKAREIIKESRKIRKVAV